MYQNCLSPSDPTWFAVNLGILVCIHCSGAHRHTGCHNSRIRSLDLDNPTTAELLVSLLGRGRGLDSMTQSYMSQSFRSPLLGNLGIRLCQFGGMIEVGKYTVTC